MNLKIKRYKELEFYLTCALLANTVLFVIYLFVAGAGIIALKFIIAILALALSSLIVYCLYVNKELLRQRSLWITVGAVSIFLCTLISLILNYPCPAIK